MKIIRSAFLIIFFAIASFGATAHASVSVGTIDTTNKYTKICQDSSCTDFGNINWKPTINANTPGATAVTITDSSITGHLWGDEIGWVNMAPTGAGVTINPSTGVLSGKAFSNTGSWINFSPTGFEVTLVDNGSGSNFSGWAWVSGPNGGWMKFDCAVSTTCISTDWRTTSNRSSGSVSGSSGSSGGGGQSSGDQNLNQIPVVIENSYQQPRISPLELMNQDTQKPILSRNMFDTDNDGEPDIPKKSMAVDEKKEVSIIKLPFVPKSLEIPLSLSKKIKIDLFSVAIAAVFGLIVWKFVIKFFIKLLFK